MSLPGIKTSEEVNTNSEFGVMSGSPESIAAENNSMQEPGNRQCLLCPKILDARQRLREHVLNHYKPQLLISLPRKQPFTCPECNSNKRDKITLLRHYAFTHKHIYEYSNDKELVGKSVGETATIALEASVVSSECSDGDITRQETLTSTLIAPIPINQSVPSSPTTSLYESRKLGALGPSSSVAPSGVYMCPKCDYITSQEEELKEHTEVIHIAEDSSDIQVLQNPIKEKVDTGNYRCTICLVYSANSLSDLKEHGENFHHTTLRNVTRIWERKTYNEGCEENDKSMHEVLKNSEGVRGKEDLVTDELEDVGVNKAKMSGKILKHPTKVKCPHCDHVNWSKAYKYSIIDHLKNRHLGTPYLKCPFCDKVTPKFPFLHCHLRDAHKWIWDVKKRGNQKRSLKVQNKDPDPIWDVNKQGHKKRSHKRQNRVPIKRNIISPSHPTRNEGRCQTATKETPVMKYKKTDKTTRRKRGRPPMPKKVSTSKIHKNVQEPKLVKKDIQNVSNMLCVNYLEIVPRPKLETLEDPMEILEQFDPLSIE